MNITDVRVRRLFNGEDHSLKAVVSITLDGAFAIHGLRVIQGKEKLFVAMPSRKDGNGNFRDIAHPIVSETRVAIEDAVIAQYQAALAEQQAD